MMSIDSKLWRVRSYNVAYATIEQRASGIARVVSRCDLPSAERLAAMSEKQFDRACRAAFHGEKL